MKSFRDMAEQRIQDAIEEGLFDDLPGKGEPLRIRDESSVPAELRSAYSVLRGAGMLPEEMELRKSLVTLRDLIDAATEGDEAARLENELRDAEIRYDLLMQRHRRGRGSSFGRYRGAVAGRLFGR